MAQTGAGPCGIASSSDGIWVGVYGAGVVLRLDGRGRITRRVAIGRWACHVALSKSAVFVTRDRAAQLVRLDLRTGRIRTVRVDASPFDVLLAAGAVWTTGWEHGTVTRLDPVTLRAIAVVRVSDNPAGLAWCAGRIWVGHGRRARMLTAMDPKTLRTRRVDAAAEAPGRPTCINGDIWVTTLDSVLRLDGRTGSVLSRTHLGGTPAEAASAADGLVWVTDKERSLVHRVDPQTGVVVDSFPAGPGAFSQARMGRSMWITSFAGSDVRRFDP